MSRYNTFSDALKKQYGEKVYKIPIALSWTCPNRDGNLSQEGCIFCGSIGAGYEKIHKISVSEQLKNGIFHIGPKYKANKFIAYFLNFSNTYMPLGIFKKAMEDAAGYPGIVRLHISTRPDCINDIYLDVLQEIQRKYEVDITIELGLQSANTHTLIKLNRCHTVAEFIDAAIRIGKYGFGLCTHIIADLPWDDSIDVIEAAKLVSVLPVTEVKLHSLFIVKDTILAKEFLLGNITLLPIEEYVQRVILFLTYVRPDMIMQRMVGRAAGDTILKINEGKPWWEIKKMIDVELERLHLSQWCRCNYLNGSALQRFCGEYDAE